MNKNPDLLRFDQPLPCGVTDCHNMASVASVEPDPRNPGFWLIFPRCRSCTERMVQIYDDLMVSDRGDREPEPSGPDTDTELRGAPADFLYRINPEG